MTAFGEYAPYYNLMYREKVYGEEAEFVIAELLSVRQPVSRILDLGCGSGVHALHFAATGRRVHGVDLSIGMLDLARRKIASAGPQIAERVSLQHCDIRDLDAEKSFEAVVSLFHVMSYQTRDKDIAATIATARRHLPEGCPFLFDFWHGPAVLKSGPTIRRREVEDEHVHIVRIATPTWHKDENRVDVAYRFTISDKANGAKREFAELHTMRYFFPEELERALQRGGFRVKKCAEWLTGRDPHEDAFSAYIVAA